MKFRWNIAPAQPALAADLAAQLGLSPLLAQCLLNRSIGDPDSIRSFLEPRLKHLADPFLLPGMAAAVERLLHARAHREPLAIFGDYDVDGVSSTTLLLESLRTLGWIADAHLPHRMDEGYGLTREGVENCLKKYPVKLLLAVDCGSTSNESIAWLNSRGIDVIVLDHHQVSDPPPPALALVNPRAQAADPSAPFPFAELCSVGLAFKLVHALVKAARQQNLPAALEFDLRPLLDLVALGTIADVVPLTGENRILVTAGLERLGATRRPGLIALKNIAQCPVCPGVHEVGFQLAPRLNASGRLETAEASLHLLLAPTLAEALPLAVALNDQNKERQKIERDMLDEAVAQVRRRFNPATDFVIVEGQPSWHIGVVGIVAARILQQFYRPTIILGGEGEQWRGSGRSIPGFDLAAGLRRCADLLVRHGGHAMAAGVSLRPENLDAFRQRFNQVAAESLQLEQLQPALRLDAEIALRDLNLEALAALDKLKPLGQSNPVVQLCARNLRHRSPVQRIGAEKQHLKMWVTDGRTTHEAIWWGGGKEPELPDQAFDLAFVPQINEFNGRRSVQLKVLDWAPATPSPLQPHPVLCVPANLC